MPIKSVKETTENIKWSGEDMTRWHKIQRSEPQNNTGVSCRDNKICLNDSILAYKKSKFSPIKFGTNRNMLLSAIFNQFSQRNKEGKFKLD